MKAIFFQLFCYIYLLFFVLPSSDAAKIDNIQNQIRKLVNKVFNLELAVDSIQQNGGSVVNCSCSLALEEKVDMLTSELQKEERNRQMEDQISSLLQKQEVLRTSDLVSSTKVGHGQVSESILENALKGEKRARKRKDGEHDNILAQIQANIMVMNQSVRREVVGDCNDRINVVNSSLYNEVSSLNENLTLVLANVSALQQSVSQLEEENTIQTASIGSLEIVNNALLTLLEPQLYTEWSEWGPCHVRDGDLNRRRQTRSKRCRVSSVCPERTELRNCCPAEYEKLTGFNICIRYVLNVYVILPEAQNNCSNDNDHIVFINSKEKQNAVLDFLRENARDRYEEYDILIDGRRYDDGWKNSRGEPMTYFDWEDGSPNSFAGSRVLFLHGATLKMRNGYENWYTRILCEKIL